MKLKTYNQNMIMAIIALSGTMIGSEVSSLSPFLDSESFGNFFGVLLKREQAILAASNAIGAVIGCVICGTFADVFGCVVSFQVSNLLWIIGSVIVIISQYVYVLILGRVVKGSSIGFISCLVPMYISELFPINVKGSSISLFHTWVTSGTTVMYIIGYFFRSRIEDYYGFKWAWAIPVIPSLLSMLLTISLPESPKWLASKSKWVEAARTLERVRTIKKKGLNEKGLVIEAYSTGSKIKYCKYSDLFTHFRQSMISGLTLHFFIQLTSVNVLMYFFQYVCYMSGVEGDLKVVFASSQYVLFGALTLVPILLVDDARRVDFMSYGSCVIALTFISLFIISVVFAIPSQDPNSPLNWVLEKEPASALLALMLFLVSTYSSSIISVSWVYTGELFPDESRAKGVSICMCMSWIVNATTTLLFPICIETCGYYVFLVLGCCMLVGTYFLSQLPETKVRKDELASAVTEEIVEDIPEEVPYEIPEEEAPEQEQEQPKIQDPVKYGQDQEQINDAEDLEPNEDISSVKFTGSIKKPINPWETQSKPISNHISLELSGSSVSGSSPQKFHPNTISNFSSFSNEDTVDEVLNCYSATASDSFSDWGDNHKHTLGNNVPGQYEANTSSTEESSRTNASDANVPGWNPLVGSKQVPPVGFMKFDTLRVASRNHYETQYNKPLKKSKNLLRS